MHGRSIARYLWALTQDSGLPFEPDQSCHCMMPVCSVHLHLVWMHMTCFKAISSIGAMWAELLVSQQDSSQSCPWQKRAFWCLCRGLPSSW